MFFRRLLPIVSTAAGLLAGCASTPKHDHARGRNGIVYYLDGAGGGSILTNWGRGVEVGLEAGGFEGDFRNFTWQTGFGVVADQNASVRYKRSKARKLARRVVEYVEEHPNAPVDVIALSAGTAAAVFTLEALPKRVQVDNLILLGSSLSQHYDLSKALTRVSHKAYVFTSEKDAVLKFLVPAAGTADRQFCGACAAGLHGFHLPHGADEATRDIYSKLENIEWQREFARAGHTGGHTGAVNARFVAQYIAPLLTTDGPRFLIARPPQEESAEKNTGKTEPPS
jgi:hypothetical protein